MHYLNHAGTSWPKPDPVHRAVEGALKADPRTHNSLYETALGAVRSEFGEAATDGQFLFATGCTAALSLALGDLPWAADDVIVTSSLEHHALGRGVQALSQTRGVEHVAVSYAPGRPFNLTELSNELAEGRVRVVAVTAASNITGELLPVPQISALTQKHGALLLVDAAQTFGTDLFVESAELADIVVAAGHKAALGPHGIGVLFAKAGVRFDCPTATCEVGEAACGSFPSFCDAGSVNISGACGLAAGLAWSRPRRTEIGNHTRALGNTLRRRLMNRSDIKLLGPKPTSDGSPDVMMNGVVSFVPNRLPLSKVAAHFAAHGVALRVGTHCAPMALNALGEPAGTARVSFGASNTQDCVERVIAALDAV